jgi:hypothetical protein
MSEEPIARRLFVVDGTETLCSFFRPQPDGRDYSCRYEIAWSEGSRTRKIMGVDEVQALLLAMQTAHIDLLAARENDGRQVTYLDGKNLDLPVAESVRHWIFKE